jgi:DNA-binding NarL/FixJ family response regulator
MHLASPTAALEMESLRCVIIDDNASFLKASRALLEAQGVAIVGLAATAAEGISCATQVDHDVVLIDIDLGEENGLELARTLHGTSDANIILISTHPEDEFAELIAESPALGFLPKADLSKRAIEEILMARRGS